MNEGYIDMIPIKSFQNISRLVGFISLLITLFVLGPVLACAQEFQEEQKFVRTTKIFVGYLVLVCWKLQVIIYGKICKKCNMVV